MGSVVRMPRLSRMYEMSFTVAPPSGFDPFGPLPLPHATAIATDGTNVYYSSGTITRVSLLGGPHVVLAAGSVSGEARCGPPRMAVDDTARVDLCLGEREATVSLAPADARRLAQAILQQIEAIEGSPDTRQ